MTGKPPDEDEDVAEVPDSVLLLTAPVDEGGNMVADECEDPLLKFVDECELELCELELRELELCELELCELELCPLDPPAPPARARHGAIANALTQRHSISVCSVFIVQRRLHCYIKKIKYFFQKQVKNTSCFKLDFFHAKVYYFILCNLIWTICINGSAGRCCSKSGRSVCAIGEVLSARNCLYGQK